MSTRIRTLYIWFTLDHILRKNKTFPGVGLIEQLTLGIALLNPSSPKSDNFFVFDEANLPKHILHYVLSREDAACMLHVNKGLLPDTQNCGLRMRRGFRERFPRHRL